MPILEIYRGVWGGSFGLKGPLKPGESIQGKLHGKPVEICADENHMLLDNVVLDQRQWAVLLDSDKLGFLKRMVVLLSDRDFDRLQELKMRADVPLFGASHELEMADVLTKLFIKGEENCRGK